ncbi:hypothetical protein ACFLU9_01910 [Chloroflexota bacterium]
MSERFAGTARIMLKSRGKSGIPIFVIPWDVEEMSDAELSELAESQFPKVLETAVG